MVLYDSTLCDDQDVEDDGGGDELYSSPRKGKTGEHGVPGVSSCESPLPQKVASKKGYVNDPETRLQAQLLADWIGSTAGRDAAVDALASAKLGTGSYCVRVSGGSGKALTCITDNGKYGHYRFQGASPNVELLDVPEVEGQAMSSIEAWIVRLSKPDAKVLISTALTFCIPCPTKCIGSVRE